MSNDQKNLFLAMGLSLLVIIAWQYFYGAPQMEQARQQQALQQQTTPQPSAPGQPPSPDLAPGVAPDGAPTPPRDGLAAPGVTTPDFATPGLQIPDFATPQAPGARAPAFTTPAPLTQPITPADTVSQPPRVTIDTPSLSGTINLTGGRIDDVRLRQYQETIDPDSPIVTLLSPADAANPYYVENGFVTRDSTLKLPQPDTVWRADRTRLTTGSPVTLSWDNGEGLVFRRTISVDEHYMFTITNAVENNTSSSITLYPYSLVARVGQPPTEGWFVLHEGLIGVVGDSRVQEITYDAIVKETNRTRIMNGTGGWLGITDKYWAVAVIPDQQTSFTGRFWASEGPRRTFQTDVLEAPRVIGPGMIDRSTVRVFAGAKETQIIDRYQTDFGIKNFELMIDWGWFYFITKPLFWAIDYIFRIVGNFGFAILIITVLIKLAFFPLANRSYESMAKMKAVQPEMKNIQERYANDKQQMQKELMALYKREKINPVAGCWPILIQIPVFFALYKVIFITIEMRHAPFVGWIRDLSAPDPTNLFNLFGLLPFDPTAIPLLGPFLAVGVWPLLMGISMFVQMKMNPEPTDPVQKTMFAWMPVIFTFMLATFPSGLIIYWTWNNILSVAQQYYIMRKQGVKVELWDNLASLFRKKSV